LGTIRKDVRLKIGKGWGIDRYLWALLLLKIGHNAIDVDLLSIKLAICMAQ
jgi:hypothetical protein